MKRSMLTHQTATVKMRRLIMILIIFGVQIFGASIGPNEQNPGALSKSDGSVQNDADLAHVSNGSQVLDNKEKVENPENDPNNNPFDDDSFFNLINEEIAQTINSDGDPPKHELGDNEMDPDKLGTFSYIHKYSRKYDLEIPNKIYDKVHKFQDYRKVKYGDNRIFEGRVLNGNPKEIRSVRSALYFFNDGTCVDSEYTSGLCTGWTKKSNRHNHVIYDGHFEDSRYNGVGKQFSEDKNSEMYLTYHGNFSNGKRNGPGTQYYDNSHDHILYKGQFLNNSMHGKGTVYYKNGAKFYIGNLNNGLASGKGQVYRKDGTVLYDGESVKEVPHGKGAIYYPNGRLNYIGEWKNGSRHGKGKVYDPNGVLKYFGEWKNDMRHGKGAIYYPNGRLNYIGEWKNGSRHGKGKVYDPNGVLKYFGEWKNDMRHGKGTVYYSNGKECYTGQYLDGRVASKFHYYIGSMFS
eukprot:148113_1